MMQQKFTWKRPETHSPANSVKNAPTANVANTTYSALESVRLHHREVGVVCRTVGLGTLMPGSSPS